MSIFHMLWKLKWILKNLLINL